MFATHQFILIALNGLSINSAVELSQNSIDSLNQLTTILAITFIPLTIVLVYGSYMYFSLKKNKAHITK